MSKIKEQQLQIPENAFGEENLRTVPSRVLYFFVSALSTQDSDWGVEDYYFP